MIERERGGEVVDDHAEGGEAAQTVELDEA
jgi:hypothetical protein